MTMAMTAHVNKS